MHKLVIVLCILAVAGSAVAVVDPDPNGIGIWFDLTADTNFVEAEASTIVPT